MSKYYIVRYQAGPIDMWLNTWLDYYDAFREAQSLNEARLQGVLLRYIRRN